MGASSSPATTWHVKMAPGECPMEMTLLEELTTAQRVLLVMGGCIVVVLGAQAWILTHLIPQNDQMLRRFEALEGRIGAEATRREPIGGTARAILESTLPDRRTQAAARLQVGDAAPDLRLEDLTGATRTLDDFLGSEMVLLFWDPGCDFCKKMLEELKAWESVYQDQATKLLVVSRGAVTTNTKMGLHAPVVLDPGGHVSSRYGATATPSAVLIDADGKIAAPLVRGIRACKVVLERFAAPANGGAVGTQNCSVSL